MYPDWRRILDLDTGHLAAIGLVERPFGLSSVLRMRSDEVDDESGYGAFAEALRGDVVERARTATLRGGRRRTALGARPAPRAADRRTRRAGGPGRGEPDVGASSRLRASGSPTLRRVDAAWSARLDDEFGALRTRIAFEFQREMRSILRDAQGEIEATDPAAIWPDLSTRVQDLIATSVRGAFRNAATGAADVQATIAALLGRRGTRRRRTTCRRSPSTSGSSGRTTRSSRVAHEPDSDRATAS